MQSGRRRKSVEPTASATAHHFASNGFMTSTYTNSNNFRHNYSNIVNNTVNNYQNVAAVPTNAVNGCLSFPSPSSHEFAASKYCVKSSNNNNTDKSMWHNSKRHVRNMDRRNSDVVGNSRTNSNSSASAVDENRNEDKNFRTSINTPPPLAYSPIVQYGLMHVKYNTRNFHNNRSVRGGAGLQNNNGRSHNTYSNNPSKTFQNKNSVPFNKKPNTRNFNKPAITSKPEEPKDVVGCSNANDNQVQSSNIDIASGTDTPLEQSDVSIPQTNSSSLPLQIPPGGSQNFIPPARRTRRSVRRTTHVGTPLSEIGAGDAPLPSTEVADTCKKLDNLKL